MIIAEELRLSDRAVQRPVEGADSGSHLTDLAGPIPSRNASGDAPFRGFPSFRHKSHYLSSLWSTGGRACAVDGVRTCLHPSRVAGAARSPCVLKATSPRVSIRGKIGPAEVQQAPSPPERETFGRQDGDRVSSKDRRQHSLRHLLKVHG